jgi:hypothetical protein
MTNISSIALVDLSDHALCVKEPVVVIFAQVDPIWPTWGTTPVG